MQLFVLSNTGRPSMGWNLGLGGAVPQPTYAPPALPPPFSNGVYGITNNGRDSCDNYLTALDCNVSNSVQIGSSGELRRQHSGILNRYLRNVVPEGMRALIYGHLDAGLRGEQDSKAQAQQSRESEAAEQQSLKAKCSPAVWPLMRTCNCHPSWERATLLALD